MFDYQAALLFSASEVLEFGFYASLRDAHDGINW